jgi:D-ribose pyranose/furanose isomerase RbsD
VSGKVVMVGSVNLGPAEVDLVCARNQPRLLPVLEVVRAEPAVEEAVVAEESSPRSRATGRCRKGSKA